VTIPTKLRNKKKEELGDLFGGVRLWIFN